MINVTIDNNTPIGKRLVAELSKHKEVVHFHQEENEINEAELLDWNDVKNDFTQKLRAHYGEHFLSDGKI